jgi:hypothetical protein
MPGNHADIEQRIQGAAAELHPLVRLVPAPYPVLVPGLPDWRCQSGRCSFLFPFTLTTGPAGPIACLPLCDDNRQARRRRL